jgi:hypothetical protein
LLEDGNRAIGTHTDHPDATKGAKAWLEKRDLACAELRPRK